MTRSLEEALLQAKIPYRLYSGVPFFGRAEIKDALSYLRMVIARDDLSFRRIANVPKRNLGRRRMAFLEDYAGEHHCTLYQALQKTLEDEIFKGTQAAAFVRLVEDFSAVCETLPASELLSALLHTSGYEAMLRTEGSQERLDNLAELKQSIQEYETVCGEEATAAHFLNYVALFTNADAEESREAVKLMTVHAAKGLEFPYVFLCGMNEGVFPSRKIKDRKGMEEERRLAFVAMTRAQKRLYLSGAQGRNFDGSPRYPSRFVLDIDDGLLEYTQKPDGGLIADAREYIEGSEKYMPENLEDMLLPAGTRVRHAYLGAGSILSFDEQKGAYLIRFDALPTPRTISIRAQLEKEKGDG